MKKGVIINLFLVVISCLISGIFLEFGLRVFYPQITEHDGMFQFNSNLGWEFIPQKKSRVVFRGEINHLIHTNKHGFRDNDWEFDSQKKVIYVLGDSFVSNIAVKQNEVFTEVIEANSNKLDMRNLGVNGYGQVQEYLLLKKLLEREKPDMVILMVYMRNDFLDNVDSGLWLQNHRPYISIDEPKEITYPRQNTILSKQVKDNNRPWRKSHLYHLYKNSIIQFKSKFNSTQINEFSPTELKLCLKEPSENMLNKMQIMNNMILKISDNLTHLDIPFLLVLAPSIIQVEDNSWNDLVYYYPEIAPLLERNLPNQHLVNFAIKNKINVLDLFSKLLEVSQSGIPLYNKYEQHWNKVGNKVVADTLHNHLTKFFPFNYNNEN